MVDRPHPQPLSQTGRGEKDVDRENLKIGIICWMKEFWILDWLVGAGLSKNASNFPTLIVKSS
ncbi:hypothetical protein NIES593_22180 [Hydrococcus rivularis NIES-593]|uniref:Uncharacterized protein n=2 Tax=Hydrococcus TaxID=1616833 RepID=A0A1U7H7L7_9CYAN|nr:hypothetical protein NIES593_22180 [Hydrococcus rivularis NIES-593]